jgi:phosphoribosylanthranilate isomerase
MTKQPIAVKICGVTTPDIAQQAAQLGAAYIGIVFHPASPRHVTLEQAKAIAHAARTAGAQPVAVLVDQSITEVITLCASTGINIVQCHSYKLCAHQHELPTHLQRIIVLPINDHGEIDHPNTDFLAQFNFERDFILFDATDPGKGKSFPQLNSLDKFLNTRYLIGGGINTNNVKLKISQYHPYGIDVSSSVESRRGIKDINLIQQLLATIATGDTDE